MSGNSSRRGDVDDAISALLPKSAVESQLIHQALCMIRSRSDLLACRFMPRSESATDMVSALLRILKYQVHWHRPLWMWDPPRASRWTQFNSLVQHLFVEYEMPGFMPGVWLDDNKFEREVFFHLAKGQGIRKFGTPIHCTKKMVPHFMTAAADLTIPQALRWAQVRGLGGEESLAGAIIGSRLARFQNSEPFWNDVIEFLVRESVGPNEATGLIDFIHAQRFVSARTAYGLNLDRPIAPQLSLRHRDLMWLRRYITNWRADFRVHEPLFGIDWQPLGIASFERSTTHGVWTITELTSSEELRIEGGILNHCVYSYRSDCRRRTSSIWSLRHRSAERTARVLTIEVDPRTRRIVQVKGKGNRRPSFAELDVIKQWAHATELAVTV